MIVINCPGGTQVPEVNSQWNGDSIRQFHDVHINVAVAVDDGVCPSPLASSSAAPLHSFVTTPVSDTADPIPSLYYRSREPDCAQHRQNRYAGVAK